jgi:tripartite-type tricarboxylate transporter receptor subunit TctC
MSGWVRRSRRITVVVAAVAAGAVLVGCADRSGGGSAGGAFPSDTITLFTPTAAGGATDLTARTLGKEMERELGVSVVVENRPGGAGSVGMQHVAGLEPDGYSIAVFPVEVAMLGHQGYDVDPADYTFLGQANSQPGTVAVPADSPYRTLADLVSAAQAAPGTVTVSNAGPGSIWEAGAQQLGEAAGVQFQGVPFDGGAPAVTAAVGGQVDAVVAGIGETAPAHRDGRLRVLAVFTEERAPALADVPTAAEQGFDVVTGSWAVVAAPAGIPQEAADRLEAAVRTATESPAYVELITSGGNIPLYRSAAEATEFVRAESERFAALSREG